ncbi:hypothetical protein G6F70_002411 [Rhizopus microsporus]|uniref:Extracellular membrane protein CFEM domain-containing protein n=2 Tax=Rhizopus TaxID=4842 RepID=A0A367KGJ6_RHIAZ|nr:hypothetical protein G6F71_005033 [Rhizopus microsporus]RCI01345.1 hypothetical protein CU097_014607 [Rhizopus azygosporus]KAG1202265.1 hypothetical protein G6F70_002411 [Rhizopus microsporus]KAG1214773.1 hypothetical protein G6F69_001599 [Rhizopus microsporus]KAG1232967.1 hypothetical protein G6F67_004613 [Rhizopus microsporus]
MYKSIALVAILALFLQQVLAQATCTDPVNFNACMDIQQKKLGTCGPVDYGCQCEARRLIVECYNLCPQRDAEKSIDSASMQGICVAVPSSSSASLPAATSSVSAPVASNAAPSAAASSSSSAKPSTSATTTTSSASHTQPLAVFMIICMAIGFYQL